MSTFVYTHTAFAIPTALSLPPRHCLIKQISHTPIRPTTVYRPLGHPIRFIPKAHGSCSSCGSHNHEEHHNHDGHTSQTSALTKFASTVSTIEHDPRVISVSVILFIISSAVHFLPIAALSKPLLHAVLIISGIPSLISSLISVYRKPLDSIDVHLLMNLAVLVLFLTNALFEAALLIVLYSASHLAEDSVHSKATADLNKLQNLTPESALLLTNDVPKSIPVSEVRVNDKLLIRAGDIVPCDSIVTEGSAFVSKQILTGESTPVQITVGDSLPAGATVQDAPLVVSVSAVGAESSLARISRLVMEARENRPAVARWFDKFGKRYARTVLLLSMLVAVALPGLSALMGGRMRWNGKDGSFVRGLGVLVTASPCALILGAPVAYLAALSSCARRGILVKGGSKTLEEASSATHVVFDKTGTLTTGQLELTSAAELNGVESGGRELRELGGRELGEVVKAAAALERGAVHPIATAVKRRAADFGGRLPGVSDSKVVAGQGVRGVLNVETEEGAMEVLSGRLGRPSYILGEDGDHVSRMTSSASELGETVSVLEIGAEKYVLRLKDQVREESIHVVKDLKEQGMAISVLTGDAHGAANYVSDAVGAGVKVVSNATPEQKLEYVQNLAKELMKKNSGVLMIGDGVNDAAALAASLVGVACGLSSATAVNAADVVLVREDLNNLSWFLKKAKKTKAIAQQNLAIALVFMVVALGACVAGAVPLWLAVTMHEGSTILVGVNALRLLDSK